jgi:hypothetical protein
MDGGRDENEDGGVVIHLFAVVDATVLLNQRLQDFFLSYASLSIY